MRIFRGASAVCLALQFACGGEPSGTGATGSTGGSGAMGTSSGEVDDTSTGAGGVVMTGEVVTTGEAVTTGEVVTTGGVETTAAAQTSEGGEATSSGGSSSTGAEDLGPMVDVSEPQLYEFEFTAKELDAAATQALGVESAGLDTTVAPLGRLVVYLHGAGAPEVCGAQAHGRVLAGMGFHVVQPCYVSGYGVDKCGDDIGGCRLEAFEGVDHHDVIDVGPPDSIETRVVRALEHLQAVHPGGDWQYFLENGQPRWGKIVISGISHGASTSGVIGMVREVDRAVMLSGPLDSGQAWLKGVPLTAIDRFFGFTHTADGQHPGHLQSFADMMLPGEPVVVDGAAPPYQDSHRLVTSAATGDGHGSTQAGGASPKDGDVYVFAPVWRYMYGAP